MSPTPAPSCNLSTAVANTYPDFAVVNESLQMTIASALLGSLLYIITVRHQIFPSFPEAHRLVRDEMSHLPATKGANVLTIGMKRASTTVFPPYFL